MIFFSPTAYEVPRVLRSRTEVFGMGPWAAQKLAQDLNDLKIKEPIVVFGCAGSLQEEFSPGNVYFISELFVNDRWEKILPKNFAPTAPRATLFSADMVIKTPIEKRRLHKETGAHLVDQEMATLWRNCSEEIRSNLIFVRGVIDSVASDLSFLERGRVRWSRLLDTAQAQNFCRFLVDFYRYRRGIDSFFKNDFSTYYADIGP